MGETFEYNGKPNPWSGFDCGLAMSQLRLQAESMGWSVHVMAGVSRDKVRETFGVPEGFKPLVAFVIGKEGDPDTLPPTSGGGDGSEGEKGMGRNGLLPGMGQGLFPGTAGLLLPKDRMSRTVRHSDRGEDVSYESSSALLEMLHRYKVEYVFGLPGRDHAGPL
jgi:hypothetical protein